MRRHSPEELERFFAPFVEASSTWARFRDDAEPAAADGVLVHMPHGEGDRFRVDTTAGRYRCVLPTCDGLFWVSAGEKNTHHWRHRNTPSVEHGAETLWHITAKTVLADFAQAQHPGAVVHHDDKFTPSRNKPDVWVQWNAGDGAAAGDVAFEAQHSAIPTRGMKLRNGHYANDGIVPVWLFSHLATPVQWAMSGHAVEVRLHEAQKVAADTAPLRWFNPDERMVATAYVQEAELPDVHRGEVWNVAGLERIVYTRHVQRADTTARINLDPLDDCVLDATGLHTPTDQWIKRETALAAPQEETARDAYLRAREQRLRSSSASSHRYGPAAPSAPRPRPPLPPVRPTLRIDRLAQPCRCGGVVEARTEWPSWYRARAGTTEVAVCASCGDVFGMVR